MNSITKSLIARSVLALAASVALLGFAFSAPFARADIDPVGCSSTGGSVALASYRSDGTTPVGAGTVADGEVIKYKATLGSLSSPVCAYQGGTWSITTPDGVLHDVTPGGGIPRIGGSGVASLDSALVSYTVTHADEVVDTTRHIDASTSYSGGISHKNSDDNLTGPILSTFAQDVVVHTPTVTTTIHDAQHNATTTSLVGTVVHDNAVVAFSGGPTSTGNVAFNLYANSSCTGATTTQVVALTAGVAESSTTTVPSTGMSYKVYYQGDGNYTPAWGDCEPLIVIAKGHIIVDKVTDPAADPQSFTFTTTGTGYSGFSLTDVATPNDQELDAGTFSVAETGLTGWDSNGGVCTSSLGGSENPASIGLSAGETVTCVFTNTKRGSISGTKWNDVNGNGIKDTGDNGLSGWTIGISSNGATTTATTDGSGNYSFTNLVPGTYLVCEVAQTNWAQTSPTSICYHVTLGAGQASTGNDFGNHQSVPQYCSPGYWKNHNGWVGYTQSQSFASVFEPVTILWSAGGKPQPITNATLQQGLEANGGGINQLVRATITALLNTSAGLNTGWTTSGIISAFNAVHPGTDAAYSALAAQFTAPENCPLN